MLLLSAPHRVQASKNITVDSQDFPGAVLKVYVTVVIQTAQSTERVPQDRVLHAVRRTLLTSRNTLGAVRICGRSKATHSSESYNEDVSSQFQC